MTIGERIKFFRKQRGYTQQELGDKIGATKMAISKYERGLVSKIDTDTVEEIANALGVEPVILAGWKPMDEEPKTIDEAFIGAFTLLKDIDKEEMYNYLKFKLEQNKDKS